MCVHLCVCMCVCVCVCVHLCVSVGMHVCDMPLPWIYTHLKKKSVCVCDYAIYYFYLLNLKMAIVSELHPQKFELEILLNSLPLVTLWAPHLFTPTPHAKLTCTNNPLVNSLT